MFKVEWLAFNPNRVEKKLIKKAQQKTFRDKILKIRKPEKAIPFARPQRRL